MKRLSVLLCIAGLLMSCQRDASVYVTSEFAEKFKEPDIQYPDNNKPTTERVELGRYLFYNPVMSADSQISCATCHLPNKAFTDGLSLSRGFNNQLTRSNSLTLANVAFHPYFTREGGVPSLEMQVLVPIQEHSELNSNLLDIEGRLKNDPYFMQLAQKAYPQKPEYFAITASLAAFERTFISNNSKFDQYLKGKVMLSSDELEGLRLFFSNRTNCSQCHSGFNFSNYRFLNNGAAPAKEGRSLLTQDSADFGLLKVASLRNVGLTAPYMHDGSIPSLKKVVESYNRGGIHHSSTTSPLIKPLGLSTAEVDQLVQFLHTLTDLDFINDPKYKQP